jgi:hypothetical protein
MATCSRVTKSPPSSSACRNGPFFSPSQVPSVISLLALLCCLPSVPYYKTWALRPPLHQVVWPGSNFILLWVFVSDPRSPVSLMFSEGLFSPDLLQLSQSGFPLFTINSQNLAACLHKIVSSLDSGFSLFPSVVQTLRVLPVSVPAC